MNRNSLVVVAAVLMAFAPAASATSCSCVSPYVVWPASTSVLPLNPVLIVRYCSTDEPDYGPYLTGPQDRIRLKHVRMAGLGPLLRAFTPRERLEPDQRYEIYFRRDPVQDHNDASWRTGPALDGLAPVWRAAPSVEYAGSSRDFEWEQSDVFVNIPAFDDGGALAVLVELRADDTTSGDVPAPQVGLRSVLVPSGPVDPVVVLESRDCSQFKLFSGGVFEARLSLVDAAGHVTPSPSGTLRFRIPDLRPPPSYEVKTELPRNPPVLFKPEPLFPEIAKKAQIQGTVTGEISIGAAGRVEEVIVLEGLPMGLTGATVAALETWRFAPARDGASQRKVRFSTHFMVIQHEYNPDWSP